jgi:hypothetical protein
MKLEFYRQNIEKSSNVKFHENPAEMFRAYGRTDGQTWRSYVTLGNFVNMPKNRRGPVHTFNRVGSVRRTLTLLARSLS